VPGAGGVLVGLLTASPPAGAGTEDLHTAGPVPCLRVTHALLPTFMLSRRLGAADMADGVRGIRPTAGRPGSWRAAVRRQPR